MIRDLAGRRRAGVGPPARRGGRQPGGPLPPIGRQPLQPEPAPPSAPTVRPFSVSQLRTYQRCPKQYEFRYCLEEQATPPATSQLIRGRAVHSAASVGLAYKIAARRDPDPEMESDAASDAVDEAFAGRLSLTRDEATVGIRRLRDVVRDQSTAMALVHALHVTPLLRPAAVERKILVRPSPAALPRDVVGVLDVEETDGSIWDVKTKVQVMRAGQEHVDPQLTTYAMLRHAETGRMPPRVGFDVLHGRPGERISHQRLESRRDLEDVRALVEAFRSTIRAIESGSFPPTDPGSWACSETWCPYWHQCPYVRGNRRRT